MEKICPGCMQRKTQTPICEHCGYNECVPNYEEELPIGTVLNSCYRIGKRLGRGGFGITYIAWDTREMSRVCIKEFFPKTYAERNGARTLNVSPKEMQVVEFERHMQRFLWEGKVPDKLRHVPGVVHVIDVFQENGTAYIAMDYVEGVGLNTYIRMKQGPLSVEKTLSLIAPVIDFLEKVHEQNLVHRDISPDNIQVQPSGVSKVLDYGLAREVLNPGVEKELDRSTELLLKRGYAPIEQYQTRGSLGPWTDVYALCATIYYCLTGIVPADAMDRLTGNDNVDWNRVPGLSSGQRQALEQGMAILPKDRILSMGELRNRLYAAKIIDNEDHNKKKPIVLCILFGILAVVLSVVLAGFWRTPAEEPQQTAGSSAHPEGVKRVKKKDAPPAEPATEREEQALEQAQTSLKYLPFSYEGLIDFLEFMEYSREEATYAADNCGADWYEQAALSALSYLNSDGFSRQGLYDQLEYEKYTPEQAAYGVDQSYEAGSSQTHIQGVDVSRATCEQRNALRRALSCLEFSAFSYSGMIEQLEYYSFTYEDAVYGADHCGADWFKQAALSAEKYKTQSLTYEELVDQLEFEGFSHEQAIYGANACR